MNERNGFIFISKRVTRCFDFEVTFLIAFMRLELDNQETELRIETRYFLIALAFEFDSCSEKTTHSVLLFIGFG